MAEINCYGVIETGFADELRRAIKAIPEHRANRTAHIVTRWQPGRGRDRLQPVAIRAE